MEMNEPVTIVYKNDRITMKGKSFTATLSISGSELTKIYWGNEGKGTVKITMDVSADNKKQEGTPEKKPETPKAVKTETMSSSADDFLKNFGGS